ncbi:hypothetical protein EWM64_g1963 [Hericium alpestre]|uniref:Uncharacterized protein n=1 Tax=Hericium alpestre TaxID=135208 RepID=A0A4Z0A6E6_9AGAM|nr:hypothetical protein EWM64_g1963 [Hericium alpestre]
MELTTYVLDRDAVAADMFAFGVTSEPDSDAEEEVAAVAETGSTDGEAIQEQDKSSREGAELEEGELEEGELEEGEVVDDQLPFLLGYDTDVSSEVATLPPLSEAGDDLSEHEDLLAELEEDEDKQSGPVKKVSSNPYGDKKTGLLIPEPKINISYDPGRYWLIDVPQASVDLDLSYEDPIPGQKKPKRQDVEADRQKRLQMRSLKTGQMMMLTSYDLAEEARTTSTGWQGSPPPKWAREDIVKMYSAASEDRGHSELLEVMKKFMFIPYQRPSDEKIALWIVDKQERPFVYRGFPALWLEEEKDKIWKLVHDLLNPSLRKSKVKSYYAKQARGPHFPCIIGYYRQSAKKPDLTSWHKQNLQRVKTFLQNPLIIRLNKWVSQIVGMAFPKIKERFEKCAQWHKNQYGIEPQFGLFYNLCINGIFPGQHRIHTLPHADSKNPISVCALMAYVSPTSNFNHTKKSWLVLWEAGIIIELPPWVLLVYPSSLFFHFNIDLNEFKFVVTDINVKTPTPENSTPLVQGEEEGRGSMVWFNMATMFQSAETGFDTIKKAKAAGHSGKAGPNVIPKNFASMGTYISVPSAMRF